MTKAIILEVLWYMISVVLFALGKSASARAHRAM